MHRISDITDNEMWILETTLQERYGEKKDYQIVDTDVRINTTDRELTECPALYWEHENCHFIVIKTGDKRYRCQFFYRGYEQFGTDIFEYDDLAQCLVSLLQAQADHEVTRKQEKD